MQRTHFGILRLSMLFENVDTKDAFSYIASLKASRSFIFVAGLGTCLIRWYYALKATSRFSHESSERTSFVKL